MLQLCASPRDFATPDWAKGAVMYQIYADRFCNGDPTNDVLDRRISATSGSRCHQGKGLVANSLRLWDVRRNSTAAICRAFWTRLDYLEDLGVEVIYFNPIFVSPSNHKYDIQDYDSVDPASTGRSLTTAGSCLAPWDNG